MCLFVKLSRFAFNHHPAEDIEPLLEKVSAYRIPYLQIGHVIRFDLGKVERALEKFEQKVA